MLYRGLYLFWFCLYLKDFWDGNFKTWKTDFLKNSHAYSFVPRIIQCQNYSSANTVWTIAISNIGIFHHIPFPTIFIVFTRYVENCTDFTFVCTSRISEMLICQIMNTEICFYRICTRTIYCLGNHYYRVYYGLFYCSWHLRHDNRTK